MNKAIKLNKLTEIDSLLNSVFRCGGNVFTDQFVDVIDDISNLVDDFENNYSNNLYYFKQLKRYESDMNVQINQFSEFIKNETGKTRFMMDHMMNKFTKSLKLITELKDEFKSDVLSELN